MWVGLYKDVLEEAGNVVGVYKDVLEEAGNVVGLYKDVLEEAGNVSMIIERYTGRGRKCEYDYIKMYWKRQEMWVWL